MFAPLTCQGNAVFTLLLVSAVSKSNLLILHALHIQAGNLMIMCWLWLSLLNLTYAAPICRVCASCNYFVSFFHCVSPLKSWKFSFVCLFRSFSFFFFSFFFHLLICWFYFTHTHKHILLYVLMHVCIVLRVLDFCVLEAALKYSYSFVRCIGCVSWLKKIPWGVF